MDPSPESEAELSTEGEEVRPQGRAVVRRGGRETARIWRAQIHQLVGLMCLACVAASLLELLLALLGHALPLARTNGIRLLALPPLLLAVAAGRRRSVRDLRAMAWLVCMTGAATHGCSAALTDAASGMAILSALAPALVACTGLLPTRTGTTLRLSAASAGMFALAYLGSLPGRPQDVALLGPLVLATAVAPLAAASLAAATARVRQARRAGDRRTSRLRTRLLHAESLRLRTLAELSQALRNPLGNVLGLADRVLHDADPASVRADVARLRSSAESLLATVVKTLDDARAEQHCRAVDSLPFDLHATLAAVTDQVRPLAAARKLELALHRPMSLPRWVIGDPSRLRQLLSPLVDNALRWTQSGGITIHAADEQRTWDDRSVVRIVVQDTGPGLSQEDCARLIEEGGAFSEIELPGGLRVASLAGCRTLARRLGGELGLTSRPGFGTSAWFTLRLELDVASEELGIQALLPRDGRRLVSGRVLVVDDDALQRELMSWMLQSRNYTVLTAENGAQALEMLRSERPDLVLMDVQMPQLDGCATTRALREAETARGRGEHLPIVALTAGALPEDRRACIDAGMDGWIPKPVRPEALLAALRHHIAAAQQASRAAARG